MTELVITRGYPASGKSTWAKTRARQPGWARVCRDDLREMLFGVEGVLEHEQEHRVTLAEQAQAGALLRCGVNVVVDATNLRSAHARAWADLALKLGAESSVRDFDAVTIDECVARDRARGAAGGRSVGETVIRDMAAKFPYSRWQPVVPRLREDGPAMKRYLPDWELPTAYLFDMDGTLARIGDRGPFDWHLVGDDTPFAGVVSMSSYLSEHARIIVMSGRSDVCRDATEQWLRQHRVPFHELHMRPAGDMRKDAVVKLELFDKHVRPNYAVMGAFDDRLSVCRLWHALGIPLFRVGDPDAPEF